MADESQLEYDEEQVDSQPTQQPAARQGSGTDLPIKEGAVLGTIAVVATYLAHLVVTIVATAQASPATRTEGTGEDATLIVTELVSSWKAAGWSYLGALGSGFEAEGEVATLSDAPNQAAAFASYPFELSTTLLFLASAGGALAAGYAIAEYTDTDDAVEAVKTSVTAVPPYLVFAAIAAVVTTHTYSDPTLVSELVGSVGGLELDAFTADGEITGDAEFGPSLTGAILFAGIVVPGLLAVVGGLLTQRRDALETVMATVTDR